MIQLNDVRFNGLCPLKNMITDKFQAQKEAIKFKKERPLMCEISFAEGFEHAMRLVKSNSVLGGVVKCECGFTERMALDCADKNCNHPKFKKD